jgi:hypothetical protein
MDSERKAERELGRRITRDGTKGLAMPNWWIELFVRAGIVGTREEQLASEARLERERLNDLLRSKYSLDKYIEASTARIEAIEAERYQLQFPPLRRLRDAKTP